MQHKHMGLRSRQGATEAFSMMLPSIIVVFCKSLIAKCQSLMTWRVLKKVAIKAVDHS
jgi:hypothetical protein